VFVVVPGAEAVTVAMPKSMIKTITTAIILFKSASIPFVRGWEPEAFVPGFMSNKDNTSPP
jgi:hypothetical protein